MRAACHQVPVDLDRVGKRLQVVSVEERGITPEGYVERAEEGFRVVIRADRPATRKRFSWAHELGHLILDKLSGADQTAVGRRYRECASVASELDEEAKADFLAGMLLLPLAYMQATLPGRFGLAELDRIAKTAGTSLATAMIRATWIATHPCIAFMVRAFSNDTSRIACKWVRSSRSAPVIDRERFFDRLPLRSSVQQFLSGRERRLTRWLTETNKVVGRLELVSFTFDDRISVFGMFEPGRVQSGWLFDTSEAVSSRPQGCKGVGS
jgi:Zn-dependent peptidase ImmA (M78 family)